MKHQFRYTMRLFQITFTREKQKSTTAAFHIYLLHRTDWKPGQKRTDAIWMGHLRIVWAPF